MKFGYTRVSTAKQRDGYSLGAQKEKLVKEGVDENHVFSDVGSGKNTERTNFQEMMKLLREGDEVVIVKLDRISRSLKDLVDLVESFDAMGVSLTILEQGIKSGTSAGKMLIMLFGVVAEAERNWAKERTAESIQKAREKGVKFGREDLKTPENIEKAKKLHSSGIKGRAAAEMMGISKSLYYQMLKM